MSRYSRGFRKLQFPITFRQKIANNEAALRALSPDGTLPEPMQRALAAVKPPPLRKRAPPQPTGEPLEADIQKAIMQALELRPEVVKVVRFNAGAAYFYKPDGSKSLVHFSSEPVVDLYVLMRGGRYAWLEVKRPSFKAPRDLREERQAAFLVAVREAGGIGQFVRSVDEAIAAIAS